MSKNCFQLIIMAALVCGIYACANKGKLKSPSQIAYEEEKKAKKEQKKAGQDSQEEADPAPVEYPAEPK